MDPALILWTPPRGPEVPLAHSGLRSFGRDVDRKRRVVHTDGTRPAHQGHEISVQTGPPKLKIAAILGIVVSCPHMRVSRSFRWAFFLRSCLHTDFVTWFLNVGSPLYDLQLASGTRTGRMWGISGTHPHIWGVSDVAEYS